MPERTPVTIFISSPGDVAAERRRCVLVVNRLNQEFGRFLDIRPVLWETEPMLAGGHFQDIIEPQPGDSDIVVVILWSRMGVPLPERTEKREYRGLDGRVPVTGTEWEVEHALEAYAAKGRPDLLVYRNRSEALARGQDSRALRDAAAQLDALEAFWTRHFADTKTGGFKLGYNAYSSADQFEEKLEIHLRARLRRFLPAVSAAPGSDRAAVGLSWYQGSPFRGLQTFDVEHAPIFFGRWQARTQVLDRLSARAERGRAFVLVLGASGSGKSSLVRAGVLPLLERPGVTSGVSLWRRCILTPGAHGAAEADDVFDRLAGALQAAPALPEIAETGFDPARLAARLRDGSGSDILEIALRRVAERECLASGANDSPPVRLVLVIDQLEEMFTDHRSFSPQVAGRFAELLRSLADCGLVWVIATLRSDYFHRLAEVPALLELSAGEAQINLGSPSGAELDQIIRLPARAAGLEFEEHSETQVGLDISLREAASGQDALPLLEFTLDELYRRDVEQQGLSVLTFASYDALGGLEGAIASQAEAVCAALGAHRTAAVDGVLLALAGLEAGDGSEEADAARRLVGWDDLGRNPERAAVVEALVGARLLVSDAIPTSGENSEGTGARVRLAHEALLRRWPRYRALLERERDFLKARGRVSAALGVWLDQDKDNARLLPDGIALAEAEDLLARRREDLDALDIAYIDASSRAARAQRDRRLRRIRLVAAMMAVLAMLSGLGAWYGFTGQLEAERHAAEATRQRGIAEQRRVEAETALRAATESANTLVFDLAEKFKDSRVPSAIIRSILERARRLQDTLAESNPNDMVLQRSRSAALLALGDLYALQGSLEDALTAYKESLRIDRILAAADPDNAEAQRDLSVTLDRIGDIEKESGQAEAALTAYEETLAISRALAAGDATNARWQRDVSIAWEKVGDISLQQGDAAGALAAYEEVLATRRSLAKREPNSPTARRDLAVSLNKTGDVRVLRGDTQGALAAYQEAMTLVQVLVASDPDNTKWQHDLSVTQERIGNIQLQLGQTDAALTSYENVLGIRRALSESDPENSDWIRDTLVALTKVGDLHLTVGKSRAALAAFSEGLELSRELAVRDPDNLVWLRDLTISLNRIGDLRLRSGEVNQALDYYQEALDIARDLTAEDPNNRVWGRDLAISLNKVGDILVQQGDPPAALDLYRESLEICRGHAEQDPSNIQGQRDLWYTLRRIANVQVTTGDRAAALKAHEEALAMLRPLAERHRENSILQSNILLSLQDIGDLHLQQGDVAAALAAYQEGLPIAKALAASDTDNADHQRNVAISFNKIGDAQLKNGNSAAARMAFEHALDIVEELVARDQHNTLWQRDLFISHAITGGWHADHGEARVARMHFEKALALGEELAKTDGLLPADALVVAELKRRDAELP
ncbi:ATP-binding protein [Thiorhodovibrio frisius]|uniref:Novel STAND NTPase 1 domain-containing protein n=1 Tax=Thiorhodovibrio frisius TaxID=631362 RepID=H8Z3N0_9GAMM|nr:ATP-binding protein [Thiorhodovibrio frisius]EIC20019.1 hypothetical protein Thi970DRAFT_03631 [Thiorhodovibrio frisius]WPL20748.1 photosystem I assembly protein Ycf3 [Thiorhodovibrio frisius]